MKRKYLPRKPSAGIRLALRDLEKIEKKPGFVVNMGFWMSRWSQKECAVCLAGSVMACTLGVSRPRVGGAENIPAGLKGVPEITQHKLEALDMFRAGRIASGVRTYLGEMENRHDLYSYKPVAHYNLDSAAGFKRDMEKIAVYLEGKGL